MAVSNPWYGYQRIAVMCRREKKPVKDRQAYQVMRDPKDPEIETTGAVLNPWVVIDQRGVTVIVPRAEMGQGVQTTLAALVAEELEVPLDAINIEHGPPGEAYANTALMVGREYGAEHSDGIGARAIY